MNLLLSSDWHWTDKTSKNRIDNYSSALNRKMCHILEHALKENLPILQAGDLTDTPFLSYEAFTKLASFLKKYERVLLMTIYGQHDLHYRNRGNTPLDAFWKVLPNFLILEKNIPVSIDGDVWVYGCSFEEPIPEITTKGFNILVIHRMITHNPTKEWEQNYAQGTSLLEKTDFDLIVSGDNHKSFIISTTGKQPRHLINCGSLMRSKIDQIEHKPFYCVFDTQTRLYTQHFLPIQDWSEVFDLETKLADEKEREELTAFVNNLATHKRMGFNLVDNFLKYEQLNKIPSELVSIRQECMQ